MGLKLSEDRSKLLPVQSTSAEAEGCGDAAHRCHPAKSDRERHQLSACASTGPSGNGSAHPRAQPSPPPAPAQLENGFQRETRRGVREWRERENKSDGLTLFKMKNTPRTPEKCPSSRFLSQTDPDAPQPTIAKSGESLKKPPDFKHNTVEDFIRLLTREPLGSGF